MRCFVAVELDAALRQPLLRVLKSLPPTGGVRWCTADQLHVTLKFLGEVAEDRLPAVTEAVAEASRPVAPFPLRLGTLGAFPSPRSPRVLWCGLEDPQAGCARWVSAAEPLFERLGFAREPRAYTPHVTLGRSRDRDGSTALARVVQTTPAPAAGEMTVAQVVLFESRLSPRGAQYVPVCRVPLARP